MLLNVLFAKIKNILAHQIRISEIVRWDRNSYLTHAILPRMSSYVITVPLIVQCKHDL